MNRINNPDNDRYDTGIGIFEHLPCATPFTVDQYSIADSSVGIIDRNKILVLVFPLHHQRLHHQQPPVFVVRMADRGHNSTGYFCQNHLR